jgi:hypothetical protein
MGGPGSGRKKGSGKGIKRTSAKTVVAKNNIRFEGQTIPKGAKGKIVSTSMTMGGHDVRTIDFGKKHGGKFDFYPKDMRYLKK